MPLTKPNAAQINFDVTNLTDPLIGLNSGQSGSNDKDSGFVIERGDDQNRGVIWDESADEFALINTTETGTTGGNVTIAGYAGLHTGAIATVGSIIPDADDTYDLGSASYTWRDVYVGPGSLYVNGKKVLEDDSGTITISTTVDQGLTVKTTGTGVTTVQSAAGLALTTTSSADITLTTSTGNIEMKGNIELLTGKKISDSASTKVEFGDDIDMNSNAISEVSTLTATTVAGTLSTVAQTNITSLGTLTALTVDSIAINGTTIGHTSDTDAITIASDGVVTMNQIPVFSAGINVSGGTIAGTLATAAQTNITSVGTLTSFRSTGIDDNADAVAMTIDSSEIVGIGTTSPIATRTHIFGAGTAAVSSGSDGLRELIVEGANIPMTNSMGNIAVVANDAQAANMGGQIAFMGKTTDSDNKIQSHAIIKGAKENSTSANLASYLAISTRAHGAGNTEKLRITSAGYVGIGTTSPAATLDVTGTDAIIIPVGTTAQRPTGETGMMRFNSTTSRFEGYNGSAWVNIDTLYS